LGGLGLHKIKHLANAIAQGWQLPTSSGIANNQITQSDLHAENDAESLLRYAHAFENDGVPAFPSLVLARFSSPVPIG
jgi:hypothetical protein